MAQALKTVLPIKRTEQQKEQRILKRCISREAGEKKLEEYLHKNQKARARLMEALLDDEEVEYSLISQKLNITLTVVRALEEQGVLEIKNHKIYRNPVKEKEYMQSKGIGGWIAVDNIPSWRVYKMVGIKAAAKSMNQFIIRTTM